MKMLSPSLNSLLQAGKNRTADKKTMLYLKNSFIHVRKRDFFSSYKYSLYPAMKNKEIE